MKTILNIGNKEKNQICNVVSCLYIVFTFGVLDMWLRVATRWIQLYGTLELVPNLFTLIWAIIFTNIVTIVKRRRIGQILYGTVYYLFLIYAVVQYGSYLILGRILSLSDFLFAGEGTDYISYVKNYITPPLIGQIVILILIGAVGIKIFPCNRLSNGKSVLTHCGTIALAIAITFCVPRLYGDENDAGLWTDFRKPVAEYKTFSNANFDMRLTGMYQYIFRDVQIQVIREFKDDTEDIQMVEDFFAEKEEHNDNSLTGIFTGKNLIVVMMESIDDWVITEEDTPTLYYMMNNGINFNNMYTPQYSNGYTFNTEFAFNVSAYPYSNGNVAYSLARNTFSNSLASVFSDNGYRAESFHEGDETFYNRKFMHKAMGYEEYNSYSEYSESLIAIYDDTFLTITDDLYDSLVDSSPFVSYIITYSAHLPYTDDDSFARYALEKYPEYDVQENREVSILRAKAKMTDNMFASLLERLEQDGLLEDTVIVGFADHYSYGITDKDMLQKLSEEAGNSILENTPAFIYCAAYNDSMIVDKVMQITDLVPTIMNLFGMEVPKEIMGQDIFDENYMGYAIFPNNTWITNNAYVKEGSVIWNNGMTEEEILEINQYVNQVYLVNDAILSTDYYAKNS